MTTLREAVAQALDALTKIHPGNMSWETGNAWLNAVHILREALAQPEPEPLTDEEIDKVTDAQWAQNNHKPIYAAHRAYARAIEQAHGIVGEQ